MQPEPHQQHLGHSNSWACLLQALSRVLPVVAERKLAAGGFMILRPDSGDPVQAVLMALRCCFHPGSFSWQACLAQYSLPALRCILQMHRVIPPLLLLHTGQM